MDKPKIIHFMGIGGSGLAGVALLAKKMGYDVSGCDNDPDSYYLSELKNSHIPVCIGHSVEHLSNVDLVAVSPAILSSNEKHPEVKEALRLNKLITWQEFMGKYLHRGKKVVAVAGTHGKSTTTALLGQVFKDCGADPTVEVGAIIPEWGTSTLFGRSDYFICEADEFNYNFLHYHPSIIILNNVEMDHPEFFSGFGQFKTAFVKFIQKLEKDKILIVNEECEGVRSILSQMKQWLIDNQVKVVGCYFNKQFDYPFYRQYRAIVQNRNVARTNFSVVSQSGNDKYEIRIPGDHNIANCLGVIACGSILGFDTAKLRQSIKRFEGIGRRFEIIGEVNKVKVIDDYAHHPTAVAATILAARQKFSKSKIWFLFEPHQFSRLKLFYKQFGSSLSLADETIILPMFVGRENQDGGPLIKMLLDNITNKAIYIEDKSVIIKKILDEVRPNDIIIVAGAGKSFLLSRLILDSLRKLVR